MILLIAQTLFIWLFLLPFLYLLGSLSKPWLEEEDSILRGIYYIALGLGFLAYFLIFLGSFHLLKIAPLVFLGLAVFIAKCRVLPEFFSWIKAFTRSLFWPSNKGLTGYVQSLLLFFVVLTFGLCFFPEIAHDSLAYHLTLPRIFVEQNSFAPLIYDEKSYRNLFMEVLYTIAFLVHNLPTAKLLHWLTSLLLVGGVIRVTEIKTNSKAIAIFLGAILWLTPTLFNQSSSSYTDGAVAFYVFLSGLLFFRGMEIGRKRTFFLSGILMGFAISCKLLAVMSAVALGVLLILSALIHKKKITKQILRPLCFFGFGVLLTCCYWFLRNYMAEGNPLYPLFTSRFGTSGLYSEQNFRDIGVSANLVHYFLLPFFATFHPDLFDRHFWIGPFYLLALPFIIWGGFQKKGRKPFFVSLVTASLWFQAGQNVRFLLQAFPFALVTAGVGLSHFKRSSLDWTAKAVRFIGVATLLFYTALGIYHYRAQLVSMVQGWNSRTFLTRMERTIPISDWINLNLPKDAKVFSALEPRYFYFERELIDINMFYRLARDRKYTADELIAELKKIGVNYILRTHPILPSVSEESNPRYQALDEALKDPRLTQLLIELESQNIREQRYLYSVYKIID
jgi:hypothetical protein